jgi:hypothetical protein
MDQLISINYKCLIGLSNQSNICTSKCWHSNNCLHFLKNVVRSKSVLFHFHHFCKAGMIIFFCFFHSYIKEFIKSIPDCLYKNFSSTFLFTQKNEKTGQSLLNMIAVIYPFEYTARMELLVSLTRLGPVL